MDQLPVRRRPANRAAILANGPSAQVMPKPGRRHLLHNGRPTAHPPRPLLPPVFRVQSCLRPGESARMPSIGWPVWSLPRPSTAIRRGWQEVRASARSRLGMPGSKWPLIGLHPTKVTVGVLPLATFEGRVDGAHRSATSRRLRVGELRSEVSGRGRPGNRFWSFDREELYLIVAGQLASTPPWWCSRRSRRVALHIV